MSTEASVAALEAVRNSRNVTTTDGQPGPDKSGVLRGDPQQAGQLEGDPTLSHANANVVVPPTPEQPPQGEPSSEMVPTARLKQEADRRRDAEAKVEALSDRTRALENQLAEMSGALQGFMAQRSGSEDDEPNVPSLDDEGLEQLIVESPAAYHRYSQDLTADAVAKASDVLRSEVAEALGAIKMTFSERLAAAIHGQQTVKQATEAALSAGLKDRFLAQNDPIGACIEWWRGAQVQQKLGSTPDEVLKNAKQILMQDPNFIAEVRGQPVQPGQTTPQPQQINPPQSLSGMPQGNVAPPVYSNALASVQDTVRNMSRRNRGIAA